ncbi:diguanylate cyclase [Limimaricola hongkongensis]|uniref:diguanylate cyclase n=1 Tax=Limimaricola hongkongensis DSM 17492 TaxID=1122180 RepID=A0A017H9F6_9RHOB|nr:diguanylate cyclase [Limimaricola hongkongensis]EYD70945.1 Pole remodelling regulatory diguanylate cyclase [Limimaricola hongkongensis DSM 17492]
MSGRILVIDKTAPDAGARAGALREAGFECIHCDSFESVLARLPDPAVDLLLAILPVDAAAHREAMGFLRGLRGRPGCDRLPVVVPGGWHDAAARLALLEAGACEVTDAPMPAELLQARIRNLLRARDTRDELARREATHRMLGFSEASASFAPRQRITVIAPDPPEDGFADWGLPGPLHRVGPHRPFAAEGRGADLFVIDGAALCARGHARNDLFRIVAELRSRSATRRAAQLVLLPDQSREAAMLLDLGADDIVPGGVLPEEIAYRGRRLLRRKLLADRLRATERNGLQAALTDPLTGLWNRRYALPHLARLIAGAQARRRPVGVMLLDIDLFKAVNDTHGHAAGDEVLRQVAARLRDGLRPADLLARIGGEEFLVAMPDTSLDQARSAAERLRHRIREAPFRISETRGSCRVTVSVGVALGPRGTDPETEAEALMSRADAALYAAKTTGRNRVTVSLGAA